jgi:hypothetical protein
MFVEIIRFEIRYRLRRPIFYIYLLLALGFAVFFFSKGMVPAQEKEWINAPAILTQFACIMSLFSLLIAASIMGVPLYRDIEHGTKEYYLSYPITKAGYFWGRYLGSFLFVAVIGAATMAGAWLGSKLGPAAGWQPASRYGPNLFRNYWYPYLTMMLPTLFFLSSFFFGLVAVFRNVKVIYSSGMLLFLGYLISNYFLHNIHNPAVIYLADPFNFNGFRSETAGWSPEQLNHSVVPMRGLLLQNRLLWLSISLAILLPTYLYFNFERFFGTRQGKRSAGETDRAPLSRPAAGAVHINLKGRYHRESLYSLTRIELLNIVRDNYFWIILSGGFIFMSFISWLGPGRYGVQDYPRTIFFMDSFLENFPFFIFLILVFYTGETVHREKLTRYHLINDTLPPPTWVLNSAKLLSLISLGIGLSLVPTVIGLVIQLIRGYSYLNLLQYASSEFVSILPRLTIMVLFCYALHITIDNKFAAHGVAITIWTILFGLTTFNYFNYNLLLYSYTPAYWASDMDGIGHMVRPVLWYQLYWSLFGWLLVVSGSLFYARGTRSSFREKWVLARLRFQGLTRAGLFTLLLAFLLTGGYIYYNVSYLNEYLTPWERKERAAVAEKVLKKYAALPLPRVTRVEMAIDLFPEKQREETRAFVELVNKGHQPIDSLLIDGDNLEFALRYRDAELPYSCPLYYDRGAFDWFRPRKEPSDYRFYRLPAPLLPGDSIRLEVRSVVTHPGFQNTLYNANLLHNGILTSGNLPGLGYDEGDELNRNDERKEHGLSEKHPKDIPQDDLVGIQQLKDGFNADLIRLDITVSTAAEQTALAPGRLEKEWVDGNRRYFHYVQDQPGIYPPYAIFSARYRVQQDTVALASGKKVNVGIFYHPTNNQNLPHYTAALKEGFRYYTQTFGAYPFDRLSLVETPAYGPFSMSLPGLMGLSEPNSGWIADLSGKGATDYVYYHTALLLAQQWWGQQVASNNTVGSAILSKGLAGYSILQLVQKQYGADAVAPFLESLQQDNFWGRRTSFDGERDLLHANKGYIWNARAPLALYGLAQTIGADSVNAALREFYQQWAFRNGGPYAGVYDLYRCLQKHVPDPMSNYLKDSWEKVTIYDIRILEATVSARQKDSSFLVRVRIGIDKKQYDSTKKELATTSNNVPIDIGVFGKKGPAEKPVLLTLRTGRWTNGEHTVELVVHQEPSFVLMDPGNKLIAMRQGNIRKELSPPVRP